MTKEEILNGLSEEEFYSLYPTQEDWENYQQMKFGGIKNTLHNKYAKGGPVSIVDYLKSKGKDSSKESREKLAKQYGVKDYDFSSKKNTELLDKLQNSKPVSQKPAVKTPVQSYALSGKMKPVNKSTKFGDLRSNQDNTRVVIPNLPKKSLTKAEQQEAKQYAIKQVSRDLEKANEKLAKIQRIRASDKAQQEQGFPTTRQEWADQTQAIGDKISLQNLPFVGEYIPDLLDVTGDIGNMASALASAPLRAQEEDSYIPYLTGIGAPLLTGFIGGKKLPNASLKNLPKTFNAGTNKILDSYIGKKLVNKLGEKHLKSLAPEMFAPAELLTEEGAKKIAKINDLANKYQNITKDSYIDMLRQKGYTSDQAKALARREADEFLGNYDFSDLHPDIIENITGKTLAEIREDYGALAGLKEIKPTSKANFTPKAESPLNKNSVISDVSEIPKLKSKKQFLEADPTGFYSEGLNPFQKIYRDQILKRALKNKYGMPLATADEFLLAEENPLIPIIESASRRDARADIFEAATRGQSIPKGTPYMSGTSLSDNSFPISLSMTKRGIVKGTADPVFMGYGPLNKMGHLSKYGNDPKLALDFVNSEIAKFNQGLPNGMNIPNAFIKNNEIFYPRIGLKNKKYGGLSGAPHDGQPTADEFFSYGSHVNDGLNIPMSNPFYLANGGTYYGGPTRPYDMGGNTASPMNYGAFSIPMQYGGYEQEYGGVIDPGNNQDYPILEQGGKAALMNIIKAHSKKMKKAYKNGGDTVMQGGNSDDYPTNLTNTFKNILKQNIQNHMINEEEKNFSNEMMQMGGYQGQGMNYGATNFSQPNQQNQALANMYQQRIDTTKDNLSNDFSNLGNATNYLGATANPYQKTSVKAQDGVQVLLNKQTGKPFSADEYSEYEKYFGKGDKKETSTTDESTDNSADDSKYNRYYNQRGMDYAPMNYNPYTRISKTDDALLRQLAANPSSNLKSYSNFRAPLGFGRTKMTFGYKDQAPLLGKNENIKDKTYTPSNTTTDLVKGMPSYLYGPGMQSPVDQPGRIDALNKTNQNILQSKQIPRENYKDPDYEGYMDNISKPTSPSYKSPVKETYNAGYKDMSYDDGLDYMNNSQSLLPPNKQVQTSNELKPGMPEYDLRNSKEYNSSLFQNLMNLKPQLFPTFGYGGGLKKYQGILTGSQVGNNPTSFSSGWNFAGVNTSTPTPQSAGVAQTPITTTGVQAPKVVPEKNKIGSPMGEEKEATVTTKNRPGFDNEAMANWSIAGINTLAGGLEQAQNAKNEKQLSNLQLADNAFVSTPANAQSRGDYDPNSGMFRMDQMNPVQFPGGIGYSAYGGSFQEGGMQDQASSQQEQIMQGVASMLQQGAQPEQIAQQLVQMGIPQEQVMQIIQTVMQQMQGGQEQPMEQPMRYGGYAMGGYQDDEESYEDDLDEDEIAELRSQGYNVEYLD